MACHHALRHAQDVSGVSLPSLSDHTQQVEHWRCSRVSIVLASGDMQASAVETVDTAHHCSSQRHASDECVNVKHTANW